MKIENGNSSELKDYSSTATLASAQTSTTDGDYDPFVHRNVKNPTSDWNTLAHFIKACLGSGLLAMPLAFKNAGLTFGMIMTLVIGYICTHCVQMLVKSSHNLCRRVKVPSLTFAGTTEAAFSVGPPHLRRFTKAARIGTDIALSVTYMMGVTTNVVFVASTIQKIVIEDNEVESWKNVDIRIYILIIWVPLLLLCIVKDLKSLVPYSTIADLCLLCVFVIVMYYMLDVINDPAEVKQMGAVADLPNFFSTVLYAMEAIGVIMPLENKMKTPEHFTGCPGVLNIGMAVTIILYAITGFFGYLRFGEDVKGTVTLNLNNSDALAKSCQYLIAVTVFLSYALQFYVPSTTIWGSVKRFFPESKHVLYYYIVRSVLITASVCLAIIVPNLGPIIGLVGAVCFSVLGLTFPAIIHIATYYERGYGKFQWMLWKDILIILLSLLALVFGSYSSIIDIIESYKL